jgi:hypothetical protein
MQANFNVVNFSDVTEKYKIYKRLLYFVVSYNQ